MAPLAPPFFSPFLSLPFPSPFFVFSFQRSALLGFCLGLWYDVAVRDSSQYIVCNIISDRDVFARSRHFSDFSGYPARLAPMLADDGGYTSIRHISEVRATYVSRSYGTLAVANQDRAPHSERAKPGQSDPPDLGDIVSPSGLRAQRLGETNAPNPSISRRSNSTTTGIGVIAGGILIACVAVLLLSVLPCYLKRRRARRARLQKPDDVDTENGTVTQVRHESDNTGTPFAKPLSVVKEQSVRSIPSFSHASSETAVPTVETAERRSPPPFTRPGGTISLPSSPSPSPMPRRFGDRTGETLVLASPPRLLLRPDNERDRGQFEDYAPAPTRSRSVRFAGRNGRAMPSSAHSLLPNPWDRGESPPPLPGSSYERVLFQQSPLPAVPVSAPPAPFSRRAHSLRVAGLPRSPRDFPVSVRTVTRSPSIPETASEHRRSFRDARRPIMPI